jgi:uncharacterized membrane protein YqiK
LIFGGMLGIALGLTVHKTEPTLGWVLIAGSALAIVVGVVLIWIRSTIKDSQ